MDATTEHLPPGARTRLLRGCTLVLAVGLLASCGGSDDPGVASSEVTSSGATADEAEAGETVIVISGFDYEVPDSVAPGAELTIRNEDSVGHTVTADDETTFDVQVGPGQEVTLTAPDEAGEYPFFCRPHPTMRSTLVVEEG
jgi:plastocyanin